jgi:hypothetical protein
LKIGMITVETAVPLAPSAAGPALAGSGHGFRFARALPTTS